MQVTPLLAVPSIELSSPIYFHGSTNLSVHPNPFGVAIADLNMDGKLDVGIADASRSGAIIYLGNGDGTFTSVTPYLVTNAFPNSATTYFIAFGKFNSDQYLDMVVANNGPNATGNTITTWLNNGNGTFGTKSNYVTGTGPYGVTVADFNNDGFGDIATANFSGTVSILLGFGNGTFGATTNFSANDGTIAVASGDFNRDGKVDLATANYSSNAVSVLLGTGNGSFASPSIIYNASTNTGARCVAVADINRDGLEDLVVALALNNAVAVFLGDGNGNFSAPFVYNLAANPRSVSVADFNGDAKLDIVAASYTNYISVLSGNGDGTFEPAQILTVPYTFWVATGDLNNDGKPGVVLTALEGGINVLENQTFPTLRIESGATQKIIWPTWPGYNLESALEISASTIWNAETNPPTVLTGENVLTNSFLDNRRFFRLHK